MTQKTSDDAPIDVERAAVDAVYRRAVLKRLAAQAEAPEGTGPGKPSRANEAPVTRG
jgi:hypothetical protein